ncbi:hypothetical protein TWF696_001400 [Orbilia brochopaga]|uniref:Uncharacterized protein n=1 Tax=Orbilia brochopaga TaxID=3140254 RepID=A0AAV9UAX2_9PEZI
MLELQETSTVHSNLRKIDALLETQVGNTNMHPQVMENALGSVAYLASLNTPHINLIINCFLATARSHNNAKRWPDATPLHTLEHMLKSDICEAWNNALSLPYTPLSLRKDIPLQKELDGAVFRLSHTPSPTSITADGSSNYLAAQEAYRRRMENVRRAMDVARRCDGDYSGLQNTLSQLTPGNTHGDWQTFFAVLADEIQSCTTTDDNDDNDEMASWMAELQACVARIFDPLTAVEEAHAEVPLLYLRLAYVTAVYGGGMEGRLEYRGSPYVVLKAYFEDVIVGKLRVRCGASQRRGSRDTSAYASGRKGCLGTTDWEGVYSGISSRTRATGMARAL